LTCLAALSDASRVSAACISENRTQSFNAALSSARCPEASFPLNEGIVMKFRRILLANAVVLLACAAALLASPAFAGEGWYVGLGAGWDQLNNPTNEARADEFGVCKIFSPKPNGIRPAGENHREQISCRSRSLCTHSMSHHQRRRATGGTSSNGDDPMKTKTLALGGGAIIALAGIISFMPTPILAQTSSQDNGLYGSQKNQPQYSSPAEKQQTRALNLDAISGTNQSPASLNGEAPAVAAPAPAAGGPQSSNAAPADQLVQNQDPQQQYQQQQQQYQQQQQNYQDKQGQYDDQKRQYDHDVRRFDQAQWNYTDYPAIYAYSYGDSPRLQRLSLVLEPSEQLLNIPVEGPSGVWVGRIRNVETGPDGGPSRVEISLNRRVAVWVDPHSLRFDADDHVVFTNLTREELWNTPDATVEAAGPY
jgi:hypothetical protein